MTDEEDLEMRREEQLETLGLATVLEYDILEILHPTVRQAPWVAGWIAAYDNVISTLLSWKAEDERELKELLETTASEVSNRRRQQIFERDAYRCVVCCGWINLQVDHLIPVSKGGDNSLENLRTLCRKCNSKKRNRFV